MQRKERNIHACGREGRQDGLLREWAPPSGTEVSQVEGYFGREAKGWTSFFMWSNSTFRCFSISAWNCVLIQFCQSLARPGDRGKLEGSQAGRQGGRPAADFTGPVGCKRVQTQACRQWWSGVFSKSVRSMYLKALVIRRKWVSGRETSDVAAVQMRDAKLG